MEQLISATRAGNLAAVRTILLQNPELNLNAPTCGRKILADALEVKGPGILKAILETRRVDLNDWIVSLEHPLERSQDCYSFKCLKRLRNPSQAHSINPVFMAIELGDSEKLELLAHHGADVNSYRTPKSDLSPLMLACWLKQFEVIKSILKFVSPADINVKNNNGKCALDFLFEARPARDFWFSTSGERREDELKKNPIRNFETLELLAFCYHNARCFLTDENGSLLLRSLRHAINNGCETFGLARLIVIDFKLALDQAEPSMNGLTPLMLAMKSKSLSTVKFLIEAGANLQAKDASGKSVFIHFCENWPNPDASELFNQFRITVNDCLDYLKLCQRKKIQTFHAILGRSPLFLPLCKQYFSTYGWNLFFAMFEGWKFSIHSELFKKYLQPLFLAYPKLIVEFLKSYLREGTGLSRIIEELYTGRAFDLLAAIQANANELYRVAILFLPLKEIKFIAKHCQAKLKVFEAVGDPYDICDDVHLFRLRCKILKDGGMIFPISEPEKQELFIQLKSANPLKFELFMLDSSSPIDYFYFYAQKGDVEDIEKQMMYIALNDPVKFHAIKLAATNKHWSLACKIAEKMSNKLYADEEGNTLLHFIPLYRRPIELFNEQKDEFLQVFLRQRNATGLVPFESQLRFHKNDAIGLILNLLRFLPFERFYAALEAIETLRPGYFTQTLLPKYGALLLCHAKTYDAYEFFVQKCKTPIDCKVISLYGDVYTPITIALCRKQIEQRTLSLLQIETSSIQSASFCNLMVKKRFIPSQKWFKIIFQDTESVISVLKTFIQLRYHACARKFLSRALKCEHLKFSSEQLTALAAQAQECDDEGLLAFLLKKSAIDFNFPINQSGYCIIDAFLGKMKLKRKHLPIIKTFNALRVARLLNPDGSLVLTGRMSTFPLNHKLIRMAFPELKKLLRFGSKALRLISEVNPHQVLGSIDTCAICKCEFEETEALALLTCKHLFHNDCLYAATRNFYSLQHFIKCPYCRHRIDC